METAIGWTEDRVETLKKLWAEGFSAAQIANQMGGITRNAVIGKVHRLGLSGRGTPSRTIKRSAIAKPKKAANAPKPRGTLANSTATLPAPAPIRAIRTIRTGNVTTVLGLRECMCKWPIGEPGEDGFGFCGGPTMPGQTYCAEHAVVAYQPQQAKRKRRPEDDYRSVLRFERRAGAW